VNPDIYLEKLKPNFYILLKPNLFTNIKINCSIKMFENVVRVYIESKFNSNCYCLFISI